MTKDEIKQSLPMSDFLTQNGFKLTRARFIRCPFHSGDSTPSMKVYKDSVYCFGCGWTGDVFKFYQELYRCDFKTAFLALGGEYEKKNKADKFVQSLAFHDAKVQQAKREEERLAAAWKYRTAIREYWECKDALRFTQIMYGTESDRFWDAVDDLGWAEIEMDKAEEVVTEYAKY